MITNLSSIPAGTIPTRRAFCSISPLCPGGWMKKLVNDGASALMLAGDARPKQLLILPRADHIFAGQLESVQSALARWLKEQL